MLSKHWKQVPVLIAATFVVGAFITKAPGVAVKAEAAFSEVQHLLHDAVDLGMDRDRERALHGAETGQVDWKIGLLDGGDFDRNGVTGRGVLRGLGRRGLPAAKALPTEIAGGGDGHDQ